MVDKELRSVYKRTICTCLLHYDEPNETNIRSIMCSRGFCPSSKECGYSPDKKCGHISAIKIIMNRVNNIIMGVNNE
jgi:hypothetical protein